MMEFRLERTPSAGLEDRSPTAYLRRQRFEQLDRVVPAQAGVGDALAEDQILARYEILSPLFQMRFDHQSDNPLVALAHLSADGVCNDQLLAVLLVAVGVRAIDHQPLRQLGRRQRRTRRRDAGRVIVGGPPAAQDQMAIVIPACPDDGHLTVLVDGQEVVLVRGGRTPNYDAASVAAACAALAAAGLPERLMVDCSHANSNKQYKRQRDVADAVGAQVGQGDLRIIGLMVESHLQEGRQDLVPGQPLVYGQSITDACLGWDDSVTLLESLAEQVRRRRKT